MENFNVEAGRANTEEIGRGGQELANHIKEMMPEFAGEIRALTGGRSAGRIR